MKGNYERKAGNKVSDFTTVTPAEEPAKAVVEEVKQPTPEKPVVVPKTKKETKKDSLDELLAPLGTIKKGKKSRGVQKTCYFEADVYQWLEEKSERTGVPFSTVLNLALKQAMK